MIRSRTFFDGGKGFVLFSKEHKKSEPFSYRKKVRILLLWCTSRNSNPGPTDQESKPPVRLNFWKFRVIVILHQNNVIFHPVISAFLVGFCSEKHLLHVLKPCKIRAETVHLLSDKQNRPIPHRLDGIGLSGRTSKSNPMKFYFLHGSLQQNSSSVFPCRLHGKLHCIAACHWVYDTNSQMFWAAE